MNTNLIIIFTSQDYNSANHKHFWQELGKLSDVLVVDIPADYVVSVIKGKFNRIADAHKAAFEVMPGMHVGRPMLLIRPELAPKGLFPNLAKSIWSWVEKQGYHLQNYTSVSILDYTGYWINILKGTQDGMKYVYYLYDEVRKNGKDGSIDKKRYRVDEQACRNSDLILTMTQKLRDSRVKYNPNIVVFGNGAVCPGVCPVTNHTFEKSVAFIGNFRSWIDNDLLEGLISDRPELQLVFAGPIAADMRPFFEHLLNSYSNTAYLGCWPKERMSELYRMVGCVIVPYKQNDFTKATRPIKIVEAVLAGTPVVTIPMDGYKDSSFIRFATNKTEFSSQIDRAIVEGIDFGSSEYKQFCEQNTWKSKAVEFHKLL